MVKQRFLFSDKRVWYKALFLLILFILTLSFFTSSVVMAEDDLEDKEFSEIYNSDYWKWDYEYQKAANEASKTAGSTSVSELNSIISEISDDYDKPPLVSTNDTHRGFLGGYLTSEHEDITDRRDIPFYYHLDAARGTESNTKFWQVGENAADMIETAINETVMMLNDALFQANVTLSMLPVGTLEMVDDFEFVGNAIDEVEDKVQSMFGLGGSNDGDNTPYFVQSGLMYTVVKILAIFVVVYAFFQFVWKRSFISSFGEMGKFILVLAIGLLLMANYAPFLKGMNNISNELSMILVNQGGENEVEVEDDEDAEEVGQKEFATQLDNFSDQMWNMFVDAPYLSLQYGTERINEVSRTNVAYDNYKDNLDDDIELDEESEGVSNHQRVVSLLTTPAHTPERKAMVKREAMAFGNGNMSYDGVNEKTIMNIIYFVSSAIMSIPFLIIALAILFTHLWFVLMALVAPFAFMVAAIPGQFNVLKRYGIELSMPLMVKIVLHFIMLMIMFMHGIINETIEATDNGMFAGRVGEAFLRSLMYFLMFITVFFLRGRLANIFTAGSTLFQEMREGVSDSMKPVQSGLTTAGTAVGAGAGLATGMSLLGASAGANLGSATGATMSGAMTPSQGMNTVASTGMHLAAQRQRDKQFDELKKRDGQNNLNNNDDSHENMSMTDAQQFDDEQAKTEGYAHTLSYLEDEGMNGSEQDIYMDKFEDEGVDLAKVDDETLDRNFTDEVRYAKGPASLRAKKLADNINADHANQTEVKNGIKDKRNAKFDDYLTNQGMSNGEVNSLRNGLQSEGIDTAHIRKSDLKNANQEVRSRLNEGEDISYKDAMQSHLKAKTNNRKEREKLDSANNQEPENNGLPTSNLDPNPVGNNDIPSGNSMNNSNSESNNMNSQDLKRNNVDGQRTESDNTPPSAPTPPTPPKNDSQNSNKNDNNLEDNKESTGEKARKQEKENYSKNKNNDDLSSLEDSMPPPVDDDKNNPFDE